MKYQLTLKRDKNVDELVTKLRNKSLADFFKTFLAKETSIGKGKFELECNVTDEGIDLLFEADEPRIAKLIQVFN